VRQIWLVFFILLTVGGFARTNSAEGWNTGLTGGIFIPLGEMERETSGPLFMGGYQFSSPYVNRWWMSFQQEVAGVTGRKESNWDFLAFYQTRVTLGASFPMGDGFFVVPSMGPTLSFFRGLNSGFEGEEELFLDLALTAEVKGPFKIGGAAFIEPFIAYDYVLFVKEHSSYFRTGLNLSY